MEYRLTTPCTAQDLAPLKAGDTVLLSGVVYTARDQAHKRMMEALDKGDFILAGIDADHLLQAVDVAVEMNKNRDLGIPVPDYVDENVSDKVVKLIQSYTGVVNKMVWRKG